MQGTKLARAKAFRKITHGVITVLAGIYELLFNEPAPKTNDVLSGQFIEQIEKSAGNEQSLK